jgi:UDP-galactopyranose mutase
VCLMPFARNAATRYISPTKTLEYMAAHKPIVSTSVADVVTQYGGSGGAVRIAPDLASFVRTVQAALDETAEEREARVVAERTILAQNAWDAIVARMAAQMDAAARRSSAALAVPLPARPPAPLRGVGALEAAGD